MKRNFHISWIFAYCGVGNFSVILSRWTKWAHTCCPSPYRSWSHLCPATAHTIFSFIIPFSLWPFLRANLARTSPWILACQVFFLTRYFRNLAISLKYFPVNKNKNSWHVGAMGGLTPTPGEIEEKEETWKRARWRKSGIGQWEGCPVGGCSGSQRTTQPTWLFRYSSGF